MRTLHARNPCNRYDCSTRSGPDVRPAAGTGATTQNCQDSLVLPCDAVKMELEQRASEASPWLTAWRRRRLLFAPSLGMQLSRANRLFISFRITRSYGVVVLSSH